MTADQMPQGSEPNERTRHNKALLDCYLLPSGLIPVCARCGRLRRNDGSLTWDQIASELIAELQNLTHGMCPECQAILFPGLPSSRKS